MSPRGRVRVGNFLSFSNASRMRVEGEEKHLERAAAVVLDPLHSKCRLFRDYRYWKQRNERKRKQGTMADMHAIPSLSSSYLWQRRANPKTYLFALFLVLLFV